MKARELNYRLEDLIKEEIKKMDIQDLQLAESFEFEAKN
jgi:hypothetical protein